MSLTTDLSVSITAGTAVHTGRSIWAGVRFGTPGRNCAGSGICEVYPLDGKAGRGRCGCGHVGQITACSRGYVAFKFYTRAIRSCAKRKYFQHSLFHMEERYELPKYVRKALGLKSARLSPGLHAIRREGKYTTVYIRLEEE